MENTMDKPIKLTSVKILETLYTHFKVATVNSNMTLQRLANRSMYLYLNDPDFQNKLETTDNLTVSGSNF